MPCKCRIPYQSYPEAKEWGPVLWTLLHGIAERVGSCPFPSYQGDERRALASLFIKVGRMIPCPSCKEHYEVFLKENPVHTQIKSLPYDALKSFVRDWFWRLHHMVNESKGIASPPIEDLPAQYGTTNLRMAIAQLREPMQRAIKIAGKMFVSYHECNAVLLSLLSIYGV